MIKIFTIGHSNKTQTDFTNKLVENKISILVDARTNPFSRWCPQFNKVALAKYLPDAGIQYLWKGENIGGLGRNVKFNETLEELYKLARNKKICIMCSEAYPNSCHRQSKLQEPLEKLGAEIVHILWDSSKVKKDQKLF